MSRNSNAQVRLAWAFACGMSRCAVSERRIRENVSQTRGERAEACSVMAGTTRHANRRRWSWRWKPRYKRSAASLVEEWPRERSGGVGPPGIRGTPAARERSPREYRTIERPPTSGRHARTKHTKSSTAYPSRGVSGQKRFATSPLRMYRRGFGRPPAHCDSQPKRPPRRL